MTAPIIIRASSLSNWVDCPRRGATRLFWHEIKAAGFKLRHTPRGIGALVGTAVHRAAETVLREKARSGKLPPSSVATDCAIETLSNDMRAGEVVFDGPRGATHNRNDADRQTVNMTRIYHTVVAPKVEPIIVEERFEAQVSSGLVLSGQPDIIAREPHRVRDLKTGARPFGNHAPQLGAYSLLARTHGLDIGEAVIDFVQRVASNKPQPEPTSKAIEVAKAETAAVNILRHIESDLTMFRYGDAERRILPGDPWSFAANPNSVLCHPKWCAAFGTEFCHEGDPAKALTNE